jgi:hypothetical protein
MCRLSIGVLAYVGISMDSISDRGNSLALGSAYLLDIAYALNSLLSVFVLSLFISNGYLLL